MSTASSQRSASEAASESSSSSSTSSATAQSLSSIDGDHLYQLACVETFFPLSRDIAPEAEPTTSLHPVARIDYSPNFTFIYGLYRALRRHVEYVDAVAQQRGGGERSCKVDTSGGSSTLNKNNTCSQRPPQIIRALHTSPARWLLLLGFALRQCTSNYTVWKDRRDVIMSPDVLRHTTRDQLPPLAAPEILFSSQAKDEAKKAKALAEVAESKKKIDQVAQHWLPGPEDLYWTPSTSSPAGTAAAAAAKSSGEAVASLPSPWRAVHWELHAVGCFTRFYHKNFQVWHHRRELLSYALQQTTVAASGVHVDPNEVHPSSRSSSGTACPENAGAAMSARNTSAEASPPRQSVLDSEEAFSRYLEQQHGLRFADVDERATVQTVLRDVDSKNYHAWLHLTWYLHAVPFLLRPPSWAALQSFAKAVVASLPRVERSDSAPAGAQRWPFHVHPTWAYASSSSSADDDTTTSTAAAVPASRRPTLPPSPLTDEMNFTAQLIHQDCLNNSAWCHRFSLFKEDLVRRLWRDEVSCPHAADTASEELTFAEIVRVLCMVEVDFALQWLYVDPTNESAYTHARSVATLYHTIAVRLAVLRLLRGHTETCATAAAATGGDTLSDRSDDCGVATPPSVPLLLPYLREAPLCPLVAAAAWELRADPQDGTVASATPARDALLARLRFPALAWADFHASLCVLRHVQRVQDTAIRQRVAELEGQASRVLRAAATATAAADPAAHRVTLLSTLYERSSQYMLDNFHQVSTAQYLACQAVLEEMWSVYLSGAQRRAVMLARPPVAYREGMKAEWLTTMPWGLEEEGEGKAADVHGTEEEEQITTESDQAVACFLRYEAAALDLAKRLSVQDPIRFKYWKFEAMNTMQRGYGSVL